MKKMNIFIDDQIPYMTELLGELADVFVIKGRDIRQDTLTNADILLTRTITPINQALLNKSTIRFVGTASAGFDHVDLNYLKQRNISFSATPGCNAKAVGEYVLACVSTLKNANKLPKQPGKAGIIGLGHTGMASKQWLEWLGYEVICYDPPKVPNDPTFDHADLSTFKELDLICCHPSLTKSSRHLIDKKLLQQQKPGTVLINTSRGEVIQWTDLTAFGTHLTWCFDVWPNEPHIDLEVLEKCFIATPHIAGYSQEAKKNSALQLYHAVSEFLGTPPLPASLSALESNIEDPKDILLLIDPIDITQQLKQNPNNFSRLRKMQLNRKELA